jgi:anti-anti-sigma factor
LNLGTLELVNCILGEVPMPLTIKTREGPTGVFTVSPSGPIDSASYAQLEKQVEILLEVSPRLLIFDLSGVDFISSMGVRVILKTKKALARTGGEMRLVHLRPPVRKVFEIIAALPSQSIFTSQEEMESYLEKMQREEK